MKNITEYIKEGYWTSTSTHTSDDFKGSPDPIKANDKNIKNIVEKEIKRLGKKADLNHIDVSDVTDMKQLFYNTDFEGNISQWNVSNVKDMSYMFAGCHKFNSDISKWDVSNVKDMEYMFTDCKNFNQDLSQWDVSNVMDMSYMFRYCKKFNQNLSKWNVTKVIASNKVFIGCDHMKDSYMPKFRED